VPRPSRLAVAVLLGGLLTVSGCATLVPGSPAADPAPQPTAGRGADPVAWADKVCGAVVTYTKPLVTAPDFGGADLPTIKQRLSDFLGAAQGGVQQARDQLGQVGASPAAGGDDSVKRIIDGLTKPEADITAAKTKVDAADPANLPAFQAALDDAKNSLAQVAVPDALADLKTSPRLDKAIGQAPNCTAAAGLVPK
jgi:hypothetical protein